MLVALIFHVPPHPLFLSLLCLLPNASAVHHMAKDAPELVCECAPVRPCVFQASLPSSVPHTKTLPAQLKGSQTSDGDGEVDECGMAESQSLARRDTDEGACEARVHLNIQSERKMCLERCQEEEESFISLVWNLMKR